jgi:hypothetical protein
VSNGGIVSNRSGQSPRPYMSDQYNMGDPYRQSRRNEVISYNVETTDF